MALHLGLGFDVSHYVLTREALFQRGVLSSILSSSILIISILLFY